MRTASSRSRKSGFNFTIPFVFALAATTFLFYIDEGYYNMKWAEDPGNWFIFFIYAGIILAGQLLIQELMFRKYYGWRRHLAVAGIGIPLGVAAAVAFFMAWKLIMQ
jgi:hypothetical protein